MSEHEKMKCINKNYMCVDAKFAQYDEQMAKSGQKSFDQGSEINGVKEKLEQLLDILFTTKSNITRDRE